MKGISCLVGVLLWLAGVVIANGFWSTLFAIVFPFWSLYLVVEQALVKLNFWA